VLDVEAFMPAYRAALFRAVAPVTTLPPLYGLVMAAFEMPRILAGLTPQLTTLVEAFKARHNLSKSTGGFLFDLGIHLRQCVDCGWRMTRQSIRANVECMLMRLPEPLSQGATVFITSDSRDNLDLVRSMLPLGVRVIHRIPLSFIHTTSHVGDYEHMASPYLDSFFLGECKFLASCMTTYAWTGAFRRQSEVMERLRHVIKWWHSDKMLENEADSCVLLSEQQEN
jgi:hypothetical protein